MRWIFHRIETEFEIGFRRDKRFYGKCQEIGEPFHRILFGEAKEVSEW
jgi:hypothetical protein